MKKIIFLALSFISLSTTAVFSQADNQLASLLTTYYNIKNALVSGDAATAATNASAFVKTANSIDYKVISEGNINTLVKDAEKINKAKDITKQREYFSNFSTNMIAVAKAAKLAKGPVYVQYCPMKKASWLSAEKAIRNPYYGSSMLACGSVSDTIQ
jgi:DNA-binding transcriptional regulator WhiA